MVQLQVLLCVSLQIEFPQFRYQNSALLLAHSCAVILLVSKHPRSTLSTLDPHLSSILPLVNASRQWLSSNGTRKVAPVLCFSSCTNFCTFNLFLNCLLPSYESYLQSSSISSCIEFLHMMHLSVRLVEKLVQNPVVLHHIRTQSVQSVSTCIRILSKFIPSSVGCSGVLRSESSESVFHDPWHAFISSSCSNSGSPRLVSP